MVKQLFLEASGLRQMYATRTVLSIGRLEIRDGDRIGLVGANGAGKSTLIKILSGELAPDRGSVRRLRPVAVIRQLDDAGAGDISDAQLAAEFRAQPDRDGLSGGEMTRRRIAAALAARGHILMADEPTTDLDTEGIERLERHLKAFDGALLLVSHDRALLDALCNVIWELEVGDIAAYPGNYSAYLEERERRRAFQQFEYQQYREEQARLRAAIQDKVERASQVQLPSRMGNSEARLHKRAVSQSEARQHKRRKAIETRLGQLEVKERPRDDPGIRMRLGAYTPITGRVALEARGLSLRFGERVLLEGGQMKLPTGSRTALLGPNGCGKTTLIRRIVEGGAGVRLSPGVKLGYFGQDHAEVLDFSRTALQNVLADSVLDEATARTVLARLNMRGDDVFKPVGVLSGGERAKVALARLFVADINLLLLDEPTNHLDIFSMEALAGVLSEYGGTLLLVSHDRRLVGSVATRLVFFEDKALRAFEGGMEAYQLSLNADKARDDARLRRVAIEMRMATIAAKLAAPHKAEDREALEAEYQALAGQLREQRLKED